MSFAVSLPEIDPFAAWREAARLAISHAIPPDQIDWSGQAGLFAASPLPKDMGTHKVTVSKAFLGLATSVCWHKDPMRFALLYQALWRLSRHEGQPISQADPLGRRLHLMAKGVGRDIHKMHAFVRFREMPAEGPRRRFAAWFEPEHDILIPAAPFFAKRFADMDWMIATPRGTARFNDGALSFGPATARPDLPEDASESLWATYFANIFNPARVKLTAMRSEMPKKYWKNLPETKLIPAMLADAEARVERMQAAGASVPRAGAAAISTRYRAGMPQISALPQTLTQARQAAMACRMCPLCEAATQTVWGQGDAQAALMVVGEQPGDQEDLAGLPFIGPAGQVLRDCLQRQGLAADRLWLTNAVKHFKFTARGKQRLHQSPAPAEVMACRSWLGLELAFIRPKLVLALGATAAFALTDRNTPLRERRGRIEKGLHNGDVLVSWHPAFILRLPDAGAKAEALAQLQADLALALEMTKGA